MSSDPLVQEVQASRKLIADLRALHQPRDDAFGGWECQGECMGWPCPTIRMIDEAGL